MMMDHTIAPSRWAALLGGVVALAALLSGVHGCQTAGQTGIVAGAGLGALMGQAIGGNTTATLIGTGVGAGVGYVIGNEVDKSRANELTRQQAQQIAELQESQRRLEAQRSAPGGSAGAPAPGSSALIEPRYTNSEVGALGDTRWAVVSVNPRDALGRFASMIVEFRPNGRVLTTTTGSDGMVRSADEAYRVVNDTLIINRSDYLINARFSMTADQLVVSAERFSAVLQRLPG